MKIPMIGSRVASLDPTKGLRSINDMKARGSHRLRGKGLQKQRERIFLRDRYTCQECGAMRPASELEMDHDIPLFENGSSGDDNCRTLCKEPCHAKKTAREKARANVSRW